MSAKRQINFPPKVLQNYIFTQKHMKNDFFLLEVGAFSWMHFTSLFPFTPPGPLLLPHPSLVCVFTKYILATGTMFSSRNLSCPSCKYFTPSFSVPLSSWKSHEQTSWNVVEVCLIQQFSRKCK